MARQLDMKMPTAERKSRSLCDVVDGILKKYGPRKEAVLASQLGCSESHLSEVRHGKKHWPDEWLRFIGQQYDYEHEIATYFADLRQLEVRPPREMGPAEWKRRVLYTLRKHNGVGESLLAEAMALPADVFADDEGLDR